ncbi:MAG: 30S ribosomal protein S20 [Clostridia bacterium]|nr:30S ribosomal protein S20 [Clostridia bacterium]
MANIKSAKKRVNVNNKKNAENRAVKSQIKTVTKKFEAAVAQKEVESAQALLSQAVSTLDSAVSKKVIHKNTASRRKARLAKLLETVK